jgi:hypothetical protein
MDFVPEDALKFQGLLEDDEAPFPDISAELPGVPLEDEEYDFQVVTDEPEPDFEMQILTQRTACVLPEWPWRLRQPHQFGLRMAHT